MMIMMKLITHLIKELNENFSQKWPKKINQYNILQISLQK
jgi:hypothetical protein